jgi:hypothetical protein
MARYVPQRAEEDVMARSRWHRVVVGLLLVGLVVGVDAHAGAQAGDYTISLGVFNCPPGMSAETIDSEECSPATDGFDVRITSLSGVMAPLTLAEATLDGELFVWDSALIDGRGAFGPLAIQETALPAGFTDYLVAGDGVELNVLGDWAFAVTPKTPNPILSIYNFAPAEATPGADPTAPAPQEPDYLAAIEVGVCTGLEPETSVSLESPRPATGSYEGSPDALPVAMSYTLVGVSLATLLESDHAVVIRGPVGSSDEAVVACGEIGGARPPEGAIAIGLRAYRESGVSGIAYLAPLPDDPDQTQVSIFVTETPGDAG